MIVFLLFPKKFDEAFESDAEKFCGKFEMSGKTDERASEKDRDDVFGKGIEGKIDGKQKRNMSKRGHEKRVM